ncbi:hypothetical protein ACFL1J_03165 [Pseudomonadota bacterium]
MRKHGFILVFILIILSACDYDAPLVGEASLPIDQALLGTWEFIYKDRAEQKPDERLVIRQESANLYIIEYIDRESILYFKGWLAELEGKHFMQLEVTGTDEGPVDVEDTDRFSVVSYAMDNDEILYRSLNTDLVNKDLADTAALQVAFAANRDDPDLFHISGQLRKLPDASNSLPKELEEGHEERSPE